MLRSLTVLDSSAAVITRSADFSSHNACPVVHAPKLGRTLGKPGLGVVALATAKPRLGEASTDGDLGQALIERRPEALPAAWRRYHLMVRRILQRALGSEGDIEDLVQDVFLGLFKRAHTLRDAEAVRPFVIGIALHTLYRERRRRMRRQRLALKCGSQSPDTASVGNGPAASYAAIKLNHLLQQLTEQERTSFVLRFAHGMTLPEVAQALQVSEPTAKRRLSRARECLAVQVSNNSLLLSYLRGDNIGLNAGLE